ncbi:MULTISPECIES: TetR/AcrR family transcriptional regulator [Actinomadura]|uniref:TetR/AcrR family transcriptional regulator n=1 Tax=Actinomadura yumaensis TaxID=111807 RepID=A0ABW2CUV6_9ACTN|nr:TetR/AcrR family transcriptional regulator [Actinomadura sp. J1-007]
MTDQTPAPVRRRRSLGFLTPDRIVDAAMEIMERDGAEALTFRRLGADLGVDHTAVLRHFRGKDDLLLALTHRLLVESLEGFAPSAEWRATLADLARRVRRACRAHPHAAALVAGRTARRDAEFAGADIVLGALLDAGLRGREAASCYRALVDITLAYSAFEATQLTLSDDAMAGDRGAWRRDYLALPPDRYPNIAAVAPHLADVDAEDQFEVALELFLDAVELRADRADRADRA